MKITNDLDRLITNKANVVDISKLFPDFYKANKESVDIGMIVILDDQVATETGIVINIKTLESYIIDYRA